MPYRQRGLGEFAVDIWVWMILNIPRKMGVIINPRPNPK